MRSARETWNAHLDDECQIDELLTDRRPIRREPGEMEEGIRDEKPHSGLCSWPRMKGESVNLISRSSDASSRFFVTLFQIPILIQKPKEHLQDRRRDILSSLLPRMGDTPIPANFDSLHLRS
jgi:hypothetical protein